MVSFTGSTAIGAKIYEAGAPTMKRVLLELGGKGAALVLDDADITGAVTAIASVWGFHSGQICTAPTRAIVHRSKYDELVDRLAAAAGAHEGRRPARRGHHRRPGHLGDAARTHRELRRRRWRRGRRHRGRRSSPGPHGARLLRRAHVARRVQARDEAGEGGDLRAGGRGRCPSTTTTKPSPSPTAPTSASTTT